MLQFNLSRLTRLGVIALATTSAVEGAYTWNDFQFGAFASQGYLQSTDNNYLGDSEDGTFAFREYGANVSWTQGKLRAGAQVFGQKLGYYGDDEIMLDWANVDYQLNQQFGLRAGRVKMPRGLYNESLDLDMLRPFVFLPASVYDARLRDFNSAFNGALAYGNVTVGKLGSIDYKAFGGDIPISADSGAADFFNNDLPFENTSITMDGVYGGSLFWNTPVVGLRVGYSYSKFVDMQSARIIPASYTGLPSSFMAYKSADSYERHLVSVEYLLGDWTFAAEAGRDYSFYDITAEVGEPFNSAYEHEYAYLSAARRINSWLELGGYYSYSKESTKVYAPADIAEGAQVPDAKQHDYALSARFDVTDYMIFKLEAHYMDGTGKVFDTFRHPQSRAGREDNWMFFAAKVSLFY